MSHTEASWHAEISAHSPQVCDLTELAELGAELFARRSKLAKHLKDDLEAWESKVKVHRLSVPLEQCCDEGMLLDEPVAIRRLEGCPEKARSLVIEFLQAAPEPIREYLAFFSYHLVQIERRRRTGSHDWRSEAPSGSPEVLKDLMFKWGARFRRHRWTW